MIRRLARQDSGSAAAEMALVTPLLIALMLGSMELGHFFYSEHVVVKAVRDGARYASRQGFTNFTCPNTINATVVDNTRRVTRTNQVAAGGTSRLQGQAGARGDDGGGPPADPADNGTHDLARPLGGPTGSSQRRVRVVLL